MIRVKLIYIPVFHNKTKHIDIKYFVREILEKNQIILKYILADKMIANV